MPEWVPEALRDPRRLVPVLVALAVLVGAAVYLPSRSGHKTSSASAVAGDADRTATAGENTGGPAPVAVPGAKASRAGSTAGTSGDRSLPPGFRGSGRSHTINRNPYQGVTDKAVTLVVSYQHDPCGQDPSAIMAKALPDADPEGSIRAAMTWFANPKRAFASDLPKAVLDRLGTGYYGRAVKEVTVDDHGDFCAEQSRNDAKQALRVHKPFAVIGGGNEWDDEVTKQHVLKVTGRPALDSYFTGRRPYMWGPITGASDINQFLGGYTGRYLAGKSSKATGDVRTANTKRVFGIIYLDDSETKKIVTDLRAQLKSRNVAVSSRAVVGYEPNLGTIGVQARNIIAQMISEKVTTILMIMDPIAVQFITQEADTQSYRPEWITNTFGLFDWSLGPRTYMPVNQARNAFGISVYFPSRQVRWNQTEEYRVWHTINPAKDPPSDWPLYYKSFQLVFRGIAMAGPELTPRNFELGYNAYCAPCRRTDRFLPLIGYGAGDFTAVDDAHLQHYDPNAPDYAADKDQWQNGQPPKGAYVYDNGGRRYTTFD